MEKHNENRPDPRTPSPESPQDDSPTLGYGDSPKSPSSQNTTTSTVTAGNGNYFPSNKSKPTSTYSRSTKSKNSPPTRLGAIDEKTDAIAPDVPLRSPQRAHRSFMHSIFPATIMGSKPPENPYDDVKGPHGEKFSDLRANNKNGLPPKRGGWRTLICIGCVVVAVTALAAIGLVIGLTLKRKAHRSSNSTSQPPANSTGFPAGSYSIVTALATVNTACTSNPATWRCYPYQTFNQSSSGSQTTFDWIISGSNDSYTISSTNNPFALTFMNAPLNLTSRNTPTQAYSFSVPMQKAVYPTVALTSDNAVTECFYNNTMLIGNLYTNKTATYPGGAVSSTDWPYAVEITQSVATGSGVPDCYKVVNGVVAQKVDVPGGANGGVCECAWNNEVS